MNKSRLTLISGNIAYNESLKAKLLELLPNEKAAISSLMEGFKKADRLSNSLSPETREGGVAAIYVCADLNRSHSDLGKTMAASYAVINHGMDIQIDLIIHHKDAGAIIEAITSTLLW